jgi:hypothetical protein
MVSNKCHLRRASKMFPYGKLPIANDVHPNEEILANQDTKRRVLVVDDYYNVKDRIRRKWRI